LRPFDFAQDGLCGRKLRIRNPLSYLCALSGREKKFKNDEILKNGINKIKNLQGSIPAKIDFFSRPASLR
jgi:hypothetical protein